MSHSKDELESAFNSFWIAGMRKVNKKAARKAFEKEVKLQSDLTQFVFMLINDIKARKGKQFGFDSMHPATYLNGERWEDELPKAEIVNNVTDIRSTRDMTIEDEFNRDWAD